MKVFVVEDEQRISQFLKKGLTEKGYSVDVAGDADAALERIAAAAPDLVILDLLLPGSRDGVELCRELRARGVRAKILMLTARDTVENKIEGLDAGADDYLVKPFEMPELQARMRAVVRRKGGTITPVLENGLVWLDPANHTAGRQGAEGERLSNREFALLHALLSRPGAILSKAQLEEQIYGWGEEVESNVVDVLIHALRRKLGTDAILNVRGVGWRVSKPQ